MGDLRKVLESHGYPADKYSRDELEKKVAFLEGQPQGKEAVSLVRDARSSIAAAAQWIAPVDDDPETWSDSELESRDSRSLEWQLLFVVRVDSRLLLTMQT